MKYLLRKLLSCKVNINEIPPKPNTTYCNRCGEPNDIMLVDRDGEWVWEFYCGNLGCIK